MRRILLSTVVLIAVFGLAVGAAAMWFVAFFDRDGPLTWNATVIIKRGAGVASIADDLTRAGVISEPWVFRFGVRFLAGGKPLRAGEFVFAPGVSAREAVILLQNGKTVIRKLTVAEGLTTQKILTLLNRTEGLSGLVTEVPPEGSLMPETYHFSFGDSRQQLIERMRAAMTRVLGELWRDRAPDLPLASSAEALVLASIVETETAKPDERARIAGVFINRLKKKMRLQSDPTVVYGLTEGASSLGRSLSHADLKTPTPYNTYIIDGLPPTPIVNPGRASIMAVVRPAETDEFYFVADGARGHAFAKTLAEHNRNVARWRRIKKRGLQTQK